ncbi:MAG: mannonate dehydratase [Kiritimatiellia bacterium]
MNQPHLYDRPLAARPSPANAIEMCFGTIAEMTDGDVYETADKYSRGGNIAYVHLRNVAERCAPLPRDLHRRGDIDAAAVAHPGAGTGSSTGHHSRSSAPADVVSRPLGMRAWPSWAISAAPRFRPRDLSMSAPRPYGFWWVPTTGRPYFHATGEGLAEYRSTPATERSAGRAHRGRRRQHHVSGRRSRRVRRRVRLLSGRGPGRRVSIICRRRLDARAAAGDGRRRRPLPCRLRSGFAPGFCHRLP